MGALIVCVLLAAFTIWAAAFSPAQPSNTQGPIPVETLCGTVYEVNGMTAELNRSPSLRHSSSRGSFVATGDVSSSAMIAVMQQAELAETTLCIELFLMPKD